MEEKIRKIFRQYSLKEIIRILDARYGLGAIERTLASNWFNPLYTLYLNFRSFPFKQAIRIPVFVYGFPHFYCLSGIMIVDGKVSTGMIKFNQTKPGAPSNMAVKSELNNEGTIIFRGKGLIGTGNKICVFQGATLDLGKNFKITDMCNIGCFTSIKIGDQSWIVHRSQVLDSNYHYVANFLTRTVPKNAKPIHIGRDCWISHSSTISGGAVLPDFTIVASNSLVGKDFSSIPTNSMIGGTPARLITTGVRRINNSSIEKEIINHYNQNPNILYSIPQDDDPDLYSFVDYFK